MIPLTEITPAGKNLPATWQQELANLVREPDELLQLLALEQTGPDSETLRSACADFPLRVPRSFIARMQRGNWQDPLLLQVLPQPQEMSFQAGYTADPLAEQQSNPRTGLIHKYHGRVLLVVSAGCAINCRYCFRRHFPYEDNNPSRQEWQETLAYVAADSSIKEVILSGGDPLVASDQALSQLIAMIEAIPHVTTLRIHSRLPIVIPSRITGELTERLAQSRLNCVLVIHCNHGNEINAEVARGLQHLRTAGVTLLNQSVLLAGINDNSAALRELSEALFNIGVLPYYLHLLDKVTGAAHFDIDEYQAQQLYRELLATMPGYLVPKLVRETPDACSKVPILVSL